MLNFTKRNNYVIALVITILLCVVLFIVLDYSVIQGTNITTNTEISSWKENNYGKRIPLDVMSLEDTYLRPMQIADIYENVTIEENTDAEGLVEYLSNVKNSTWRIEIPKIAVVAPIKSGTSQEVLEAAVGHFEGTTEWNGNIPLAGHNRGYRCNFFEKIKELENGDKIIYYSENGKREYKVIMNKIIEQTNWEYVQNTEDNRITLITCVENMHDYRRCVQAVEVF